MTVTTAAWMAWTALGVIYAQLVALALSLLGIIDTAAVSLGVAAGVGWAALTPRVLRWCSRRVRG